MATPFHIFDTLDVHVPYPSPSTCSPLMLTALNPAIAPKPPFGSSPSPLPLRTWTWCIVRIGILVLNLSNFEIQDLIFLCRILGLRTLRSRTAHIGEIDHSYQIIIKLPARHSHGPVLCTCYQASCTETVYKCFCTKAA